MRSWASGGKKMGQISAQSFVIIPETICLFLSLSAPSFTLKFFPLFNDCQAPPHHPLTLPTSLSTAGEVLKSFLGLFLVSHHHYLVSGTEEVTKVTL